MSLLKPNQPKAEANMDNNEILKMLCSEEELSKLSSKLGYDTFTKIAEKIQGVAKAAAEKHEKEQKLIEALESAITGAFNSIPAQLREDAKAHYKTKIELEVREELAKAAKLEEEARKQREEEEAKKKPKAKRERGTGTRPAVIHQLTIAKDKLPEGIANPVEVNMSGKPSDDVKKVLLAHGLTNKDRNKLVAMYPPKAPEEKGEAA
ncbi:hypothetical protein [Aeromonas allosaccharophila]|uniref:hypothetical protein n=1 Tax=Aeromonas allosaccharophila TaxID=656 RepID=UPI0012E0927F|nr:hypothetical protein [Aeromonas allosaccharophila]